MTTGDDIQTELAAVAQAVAEHETLVARLAAGEGRLQAADAEVAGAAARLAVEAGQVRELEGFSTARIWSGLRGTRVTDLEREQAEQQAAEYALAAAEARRLEIRREVDDVDARLAALGDLVAHRARALQAKEDWLRGRDAGIGVELDAIAERLGRAGEQQREISEAAAAAAEAGRRLEQASTKLGSAASWATYDTFFGGGLIADAAKHARIDEATRLIRDADVALQRLGTELRDVGVEAVGGVQIDGLTRTFDVWFDNIFSDYAVRGRIQEAAERVDRARRAVADLGPELAERERQTWRETERLMDNRERLLLRD